MKTNMVATLVAATLLSTTFIPAAFAQERPMPEGIEVITVVPAVFAQQRNMPEGIEVITVVGKRSAPALAAACVNNVMTQAHVTGNAGEKLDRHQLRQSIRQCMEQGTDEVQI